MVCVAKRIATSARKITPAIVRRPMDRRSRREVALELERAFVVGRKPRSASVPGDT